MRVLSLQKGADTAGQAIRMKWAFDKYAPGWTFNAMAQPPVSDYIAYPHDLRWNNKLLRQMWPELDVIHEHNHFNASRWVERNLRGTPKPTVIHHHGTQFRQNHEALLEQQRERGAVGIVSTLDLWLKAPDDLDWLPAPYDVDWLASLRSPHDSGKVRVAHAPTHEALKSTRAFVAAMDRLIAEGEPVEMELIHHAQWYECLARKATADIFFDQVILGFGCNSVEAWGMGIPVISGVDPDRAEALGHPIGDVQAEYQRRFGYLPYYPATEDTIYGAIKALLDPVLRTELAERGKQHVRAYHHEPVVVEKLQGLYRRAVRV